MSFEELNLPEPPAEGSLERNLVDELTERNSARPEDYTHLKIKKGGLGQKILGVFGAGSPPVEYTVPGKAMSLDETEEGKKWRVKSAQESGIETGQLLMVKQKAAERIPAAMEAFNERVREGERFSYQARELTEADQDRILGSIFSIFESKWDTLKLADMTDESFDTEIDKRIKGAIESIMLSEMRQRREVAETQARERAARYDDKKAIEVLRRLNSFSQAELEEAGFPAGPISRDSFVQYMASVRLAGVELDPNDVDLEEIEDGLADGVKEMTGHQWVNFLLQIKSGRMK